MELFGFILLVVVVLAALFTREANAYMEEKNNILTDQQKKAEARVYTSTPIVAASTAVQSKQQDDYRVDPLLESRLVEVNNPNSGRLPPPRANFTPEEKQELIDLSDDGLYMFGSMLPVLHDMHEHAHVEEPRYEDSFSEYEGEDELSDAYQDDCVHDGCDDLNHLE